MSLVILFHFLCAQHVSDINISIIRNLRLFYWITTLVVLFLVRCVLEIRCGWFGVVSASACNTDTTPNQPHRISNTHRNKKNTTNVVIQHNSRKLLMMDVFFLVWCVMEFRCGWVGVGSLQHGYHSNPTTPKLQHTSNQEKYGQRGNST